MLSLSGEVHTTGNSKNLEFWGSIMSMKPFLKRDVRAQSLGPECLNIISEAAASVSSSLLHPGVGTHRNQ